MEDNKLTSRRRFLKLAGVTAGAAIVCGSFAQRVSADELPHLSETDTTAAALGYKDDVAKVDKAKYVSYKPGQACANCKFFQGSDKTPWAGCQLFPGKAAAAKGWCSGYNAKA